MSNPARTNLLPAAAFVSLLVLLLGVAGLFTLNLTHSRSVAALDRQARLDQVRTAALEAKVDFKTQVQEWKNILLRGQNADDYSRYVASFDQHEAAVQVGLASIRTQLDGLELDAENIEPLAARHRALGADYRAALATWQRNDPAGAFAVDAAVRGRDRQLGENIEALADRVAEAATRELKASGEAAVALYAGLRKAVLVIAALAVIGALWLVVLANRAARA